MADNKNALHRVAVWDWPTRVFHWVLVALIIGSFVTAQIAGNAMQYHMWIGFWVLGLVVFRIVWGFVGGRHARFSSFLSGPGRTISYARSMFGKGGERHLGHNPLGGWSVIAMIVCLAVQAGTGLFADDEIATQGPLAKIASGEWVTLATKIHHINIKILYVLVGVHVAAILFYLFGKGENLVRPMITGHKDWHESHAGHGARGSSIAALLVFVIAAAIVYYVVKVLPG